MTTPIRPPARNGSDIVARARALLEGMSTVENLEVRNHCIYAQDMPLGGGTGILIAEFNRATPRCYENVEFFMTAPALVRELVAVMAEVEDQWNEIVRREVAEFERQRDRLAVELSASAPNCPNGSNMMCAPRNVAENEDVGEKLCIACWLTWAAKKDGGE